MEEKKRSKSVFRIIGNVIGILCFIVLAPLLAVNITLVVKGIMRPETPPDICGVAPVIVLSGSMETSNSDSIKTGDLIFIKKIDPNTLKEGDVIAFMSNKSAITHRIIRLTENASGETEFITKGDNPINSEDKDPVSKDKVIGIYVYRIPKLGDFAMFLHTPQGMAMFIGVPALLLVILDIIRRLKYAKAEEKSKKKLEEEIKKLKSQTEKNSDDSDVNGN